ncbi:transferrin receptor protein 2 [Platysternon megacephalum]|uniref:Transferrin receptor protein 2 n=1 Tax=Platysternon megacephalum TaxID=55544 RepID=A0A4D9DQV5_9SAUR|nr:transferrin receptor protein 2 [Platysternon megacephalum]
MEDSYHFSVVLLQLIHLKAIGFADELNSLLLLLRCFVETRKGCYFNHNEFSEMSGCSRHLVPFTAGKGGYFLCPPLSPQEEARNAFDLSTQRKRPNPRPIINC